ncbi:MAG: AAA family ATPase, partial [Propionibacterium sp.]|nr:AAA family ATPase [Propionibacterium sp.]
MPADTTEILDAERAHLAASRAALQRMRAESADWRDAVGGNSVSTQYLKQMLHRRMAELELDPDIPLFFGRIEYAEMLGAQA